MFQHSDHRINISNVIDIDDSFQDKAESTTACIELTIEDDDASAIDEAITENHAPADSPDDGGDKMFGMLIVGELRKMTPAAQKMFKRNVTKLLYT